MFIAHLTIAGGEGREGPMCGPQEDDRSKETPLEGVAWKEGELQSQENREGTAEEVRLV